MWRGSTRGWRRRRGRRSRCGCGRGRMNGLGLGLPSQRDPRFLDELQKAHYRREGLGFSSQRDHSFLGELQKAHYRRIRIRWRRRCGGRTQVARGRVALASVPDEQRRHLFLAHARSLLHGCDAPQGAGVRRIWLSCAAYDAKTVYPSYVAIRQVPLAEEDCVERFVTPELEQPRLRPRRSPAAHLAIAGRSPADRRPFAGRSPAVRLVLASRSPDGPQRLPDGMRPLR